MGYVFYLGRRLGGSVECHVMRTLLLTLLFVFKGFFVYAADGALDCDQLLAVSQTSIALRDQGNTLSAVLAEIERGEFSQKLDARELNLLRQIVRTSYTSEYSPREIFESCKQGSFGARKSK